MTVSIEWGQKITNSFLKGLREAVNAEENPVKYLGIDPGKANGVCGYDAKLYLVFMLTIPANDMIKFLYCFDLVEVCVVEDFLLYPNKSKYQAYSDMETSRVIGRIESWSQDKEVKLIKQKATIKEIGYKWLGKKPLPKSNPRNHEADANVHFMYWAISSGLYKAENLVKEE